MTYRIARAVLVVLFFLALTRTADMLYMKTTPHEETDLERILSGESLAPNQYRVLAPLSFWAAVRITGDARISERIVTYASIAFCFLAAGALFYSATESLLLGMIAEIALLGGLTFGMWWKYRQEFFEVGFVSLALLLYSRVRSVKTKYALLAVVTLLATLNRETFVFVWVGVLADVWSRRKRPPGVNDEWWGVAAIGVVYVVAFLLPRLYFGWTPYYGDVLMIGANVANVVQIANPYNALHMGAGILWVYLLTLLMGNTRFRPFLIGYLGSFLLVALFISTYSEHRIFYPLMAVMIASVIGFVRDRWSAPSKSDAC
jgi:hypothetical protein